MASSAKALYFVAPQHVDIQEIPLSELGPNEVRVRTLVSAISPGTEMLFYRGQVPDRMSADSSIAGMTGAAHYPLRYGYSCVGEVEAVGTQVSDTWLGRRAFAFSPHASRFNASTESLQPVPDDVATDAAALFPNMETAISLLHDAAPRLGERTVIFGQGIVGLLATWLLRTFRQERLITVEPLPNRRDLSLAMGAVQAFDPTTMDLEQLKEIDPDLILELTGNPAALESALRIAGYNSRIIIGSWYGTKKVELPLGESFHRNRVTIYSSQVSTIPATLTARWDKGRRYAVAWKNLAHVSYESLITHRIPFERAAEAYQLIAQRPDQTCQVLLTY
jgi:2-desacetyl-2-hydroxyethyl bacteriochlorophyllide A dehydrogenase